MHNSTSDNSKVSDFAPTSLHPNSFAKRGRAKAHELRKPAGGYALFINLN